MMERFVENHYINPPRHSPYHERGMYAVNYGDINHDGVTDQIVASFESEFGYEGGIVTAIDGITGNILWRTHPNSFFSSYTGVHAVTVADIDNDGINDILVGTDKSHVGVIYVLDSSDGSVKASIELDYYSPVYSLQITDYDNDGQIEILAGGGSYWGSNPYIYVIDTDDLSWSKPMPRIPGSWANLRSFDTIDWAMDGNFQIVAALGGVFIIDLQSTQ